MADCATIKRKKVVLYINQKLEIIELLQKGTLYTVISERYGIGRSTVADIKKNEVKLKAFTWKMKDMGVKSLTMKAMKVGTYEKLEATLYIWFRQHSEKSTSEWLFAQRKGQVVV